MTVKVVPLASRRLGEADDVVRATIRANLAARDLHMDELAAAIGMSRSTMYRRLTSRGHVAAFTAGELAAVALALGVPVGDLFEGRVSIVPEPVPEAERSVNTVNLTSAPTAA